eukprot:2022221-Amphidinium_carterae.1
MGCTLLSLAVTRVQLEGRLGYAMADYFSRLRPQRRTPFSGWCPLDSAAVTRALALCSTASTGMQITAAPVILLRV